MTFSEAQIYLSLLTSAKKNGGFYWTPSLRTGSLRWAHT